MNKLTLVIDGGFMLMSRVFAFEKQFEISNPDRIKQHAAKEFQETMARSLTALLRKFPEIDNVVWVSEGGSWRKAMPIPKQLGEITYKGHRQKKSETDWNAIYRAYNDFVDGLRRAGVCCSQHSAIEGDDWAWYWSRRLNAEGTDVIIWTCDADLKQLVQIANGRFTVWYNDRSKLILPCECRWADDPVEAMLNPPYQSGVLEQIKKHAGKFEIIDQDFVAINKILCGDSGDNIKSIIRYPKGNRVYKFSQTDYKKLIADLNISSMDDFISKKPAVVKHITSNPKFAAYNFTEANVDEMFEYNKALVWLNEATMPDTVTLAMTQFEYTECDVVSIRNNFRQLLTDNSDIAQIYEQIPQDLDVTVPF